MHHAGIQTLSNLLSDLLLIHQFKNKFAGGTCFRENIIIIRKRLIAHMVINTERMLCILEILCSTTKSSGIAAVLCDKQIKHHIIGIFVSNRISICHKFKNVWNRFQIKAYINFRIIQTNVIVDRKCRSHTVSVRAHMSCNTYRCLSCKNSIQFTHP